MNRTLVAFLRGLALSAVLFVISELIVFFGADLPPALDGLAPWVPLIVTGLRSLEGAVDQLKKGNDPNGATGLPS
jgi:hypothetical protein